MPKKRTKSSPKNRERNTINRLTEYERKINNPMQNSEIESHDHKNDLSKLGFSYFPEILKPKIENFDNLPLNATLYNVLPSSVFKLISEEEPCLSNQPNIQKKRFNKWGEYGRISSFS